MSKIKHKQVDSLGVSDKELANLEKELKQLDKQGKGAKIPYIPKYYPEGMEFLFQCEWGHFLKDSQGSLYRLVWSNNNQQPVLQGIFKSERW